VVGTFDDGSTICMDLSAEADWVKVSSHPPGAVIAVFYLHSLATTRSLTLHLFAPTPPPSPPSPFSPVRRPDRAVWPARLPSGIRLHLQQVCLHRQQ